MTKQELFDKIVKYAQTMTHKSLKEGGIFCLYRASDGNRCFIGSMIPDEKYHESLEKQTVYRSKVQEAAGIPEELVEFAAQLQDVHDCGQGMDSWPERFEAIAMQHALHFEISSYKQAA